MNKSYPLTIILVASMQPFFYSCHRDDPSPPVASFTYTTEKSLPVKVQFKNTSVIKTPAPNRYVWSFGDGTTDTSSGAVTHDYPLIAIYEVTLTQIAMNGDSDLIGRLVDLHTADSGGGNSTMPGPDYTYIVPAIPTVVTFTNTSEKATSYLWNFGDGSTSATDSSIVIHTYVLPGSYTVVLDAYSGGQHNSRTVTLNL